MAWAITVAQQEPKFTCATHDADGIHTSVNGGEPCVNWMSTNGNTEHYDTEYKFDVAPKYEFEGNVIKENDGWMTTVITGSSATMSGADEEKLKFKLWYPTLTEMRVSAMGIVNNDTITIQLIGDIQL